MAYGIYQGYQPYNPYSNYNPSSQQTQGIIWIQGEAAAKSYLVSPNTTVALFDSENQSIYIKSADASGMPSMKILDYTIRENAAKSPEKGVNSHFATIDDINILKAEIERIKENLSYGKRTVSSGRKQATDGAEESS